jgi:hypothetical protein
MAAFVRRGPPGHPGLQQNARPVLPEHVRARLDARYGKSAETAEGSTANSGASGGESLAQRMARQRQERSKERLASTSLTIEDSRQGPPAWHGLGLRDDFTNPQRMWQEQRMQQQQKMMETQMQREQRMIEQKIMEKEKRELERHRARAAARQRGPARKESSAQAQGVTSHLKVGAAAMQLVG